MKYYCIKQHDTADCGAACLATIFKYYNLNLPISKIRDIASTTTQGTNVYGMIRAAESLGFSAKGVKGDQSAFFSEFSLPAIAHVINNKNLLHYIVIYKITKKVIVVADPAKGIVKYKPEDFFKIWTGILIILAPNSEFKSPNKNEKTCSNFSKFLSLLTPHKSLLFGIFVTSVVITILGILASFYFKIIIDSIVPNTLFTTLTFISITSIGLYVLKALLEFCRNQLMLYLSQKIDIPLILGFYQHVLKLPMRFFDSHKIGEIISRFMDASKIREAISSATLTILVDTFMAIIGGVVLYIQNQKLFAVSIVILILYAVVVLIYNKPINQINKKVLNENSELTSHLVESIEGIETIKSFNLETRSRNKTELLFVRFLKSFFHNGFLVNCQQTLTNTLAIIGKTAILWIGTFDVLSGKSTLGQLITFSALMVYFLEPIKNLINLQATLQTAFVAANRFYDVLDLPTELDEQKSTNLQNVSLREKIRISNLDFRYGSQQLTLHNINLSISKGQKVALVGESGSGKTTLAKLLTRLYTWENGDIYIGNYNLKDVSINTLREKIAYVSQDTFLFNGSIIENLTLGNSTITLDDVVRVCELTTASNFIDKLPLRYNTVIEENGANLSGGQKQRLAIARALLQNPDILILDEATSNLDSITEKAIEQTINSISQNVTVIIIAHRLSTIRNCDTIFVMENGKIIESGTHDELMKNRKNYFEFWSEQFEENVGSEKYAS